MLEIREDNTLVKSLATYASEGGGDIVIKVRGYKKSIRTSKSVRETSIDEMAVSNLSIDRLKILFEQIR